MRKMSFNVQCVRQCLDEKGVVYTVRGYDMKDGLVLVDYIGICERKKLKEVKEPKDLKEFVSLSGFKSIDDWWKAIKGLIWQNNRRMYLYEIKRSSK